jgi:hypothetical protein
MQETTRTDIARLVKVMSFPRGQHQAFGSVACWRRKQLHDLQSQKTFQTCLIYPYPDCGLTSANALASKATGATTDQSGLILKYHLSRVLIRGVHNCRHRCRFPLVKDFI